MLPCVSVAVGGCGYGNGGGVDVVMVECVVAGGGGWRELIVVEGLWFGCGCVGVGGGLCGWRGEGRDAVGEKEGQFW